MDVPIDADNLILLISVLVDRNTRLLPALLRMKSDPPEQVLDEVLELIKDEFLKTGLMEDYEPNERGLRLENLIDALLAAKKQIRRNG